MQRIAPGFADPRLMVLMNCRGVRSLHALAAALSISRSAFRSCVLGDALVQ